MFRKPREVSSPLSSDLPPKPSTGRPPTPPQPSTAGKVSCASANSSFTMASSATPLIGRNRIMSKNSSRASGGTFSKIRTKPNASILNFFKKAAPSPKCEDSLSDPEESLFMEDGIPMLKMDETIQTLTPPRDYFSRQNSPNYETKLAVEAEPSRYHEENFPSKRRKVNDHLESSPLAMKKGTDNVPSKGPFLDVSDDEEIVSVLSNGFSADTWSVETHSLSARRLDIGMEKNMASNDAVNPPPVPRLKRDPTSMEGNEFEGMDDFVEDEFPEEGEEYLERRWMEEQRQFEMEFEDEELENNQELKGEGGAAEEKTTRSGETATTCPICSVSFDGFTDQEALVHVNECLDGTATSIPKKPSESSTPAPNKNNSFIPPYKRFQRAAIARPGQENPFGLSSNNINGSSAFSKLMSSHAEDTAWAVAAASENASRGKPAYQRTCPFYKILPGFFICVDAFRYGAVEGCKAYFLSHFHSDHYIGLTSSWCHGPIYCSHVTANLVRGQLRVDPKWVFDLDFDKKVGVPQTGGVEVTMIPANHCPGSSLYLFEKVVGKGKTPKVQRVLHCGDFRACPAHVQHPRLRPDIVDAVTGRNIAQQKLDVCYLDTTYLTPKYSFPSQEEVIKACADMCVSLSKDQVDENDSWEASKKERAGTGMVNFVRKDTTSIKEEPDGEAINRPRPTKKARGRLLVIVGTYSIGKERICLGVARALDSKIYAPPHKQKICAALEDPELNARLTTNPLEAQVHMQMLMEIRAETLADYLTGYKPHFTRIVGFRPSGWNYRPPQGRATDSPAVHTVLHSASWRSRFSYGDLHPQRGSTRDAACFGVPYSEHSSFRELTMFCCALRIDRVIPTVNVGSAKSREKMRAWCERWAAEKKKNGLFRVEEGCKEW